MASLNHVYMWTGKDWTHVTAEQAAKSHPGGTVSSHSGLFICELCGQYVSLTDGKIQARHFRHNSHDKSKDCPERSKSINDSSNTVSPEHDLPIRIILNQSSTSFHFELGLIRVPEDFLGDDIRIEIKPIGDNSLSYVFRRERLNSDNITYLPIGERPYENYQLTVKNGNPGLSNFWPSEIKGINPDGSVFEKSTGKKLVYESSVEINKNYLLLTHENFSQCTYHDLKIECILQKEIESSKWFLYVVSATALSEETASFFLKFRCLLTEHPVSVQPIWPLFKEGIYFIEHNQNKTYMFTHGNTSTIRTFPAAQLTLLTHKDDPRKLYEISCSSRQQLISVGRSKVLQYIYYWKNNLKEEGYIPKVTVTDILGNVILSGDINYLPQKKTLIFFSEYDGELILYDNETIVRKELLRAGKKTQLSKLSYHQSIQLFVGLDLVWQIKFVEPKLQNNGEELTILEYIRDTHGTCIPAPHALKNILLSLSPYPKIYCWVKNCISENRIKEQSYRRLQVFYKTIKTSKKEG